MNRTKNYALYILLVLAFIMLNSGCTKKEEASENSNNINVGSLTINDIKFNSPADENNIFIYLYLQNEYALTLKQFNSLFKSALTKRGLKQKIDSGEIPKNLEEEFKKNFLLQIIGDELFYQEGLKNPDINISDATIEKETSIESLKIIKSTNVPFDQFLESIGMTAYDFSQSIKKNLYRKKVLDDQQKFGKAVSPKDIENLYKIKASEGAFSEKFREVYLIEYLSSNTNITPDKVKPISELVSFQSLAKSESIHDSRLTDGRIEDVPRSRKPNFRNNKRLISNLLFDQIWQAEPGTPVFCEAANRFFIIWVNKEFEKQSYLTPDLQMYLIRFLNLQNKIQLEQNLSLKIAKTAVFKIRHNNELVPLDLAKFLSASIEILNKPVEQ